MKTGATFYGCDVKTRDAFANMDIAGYNYGIKRYRHDLKKYPDRLILGSEKLKVSGEPRLKDEIGRVVRRNNR